MEFPDDDSLDDLLCDSSANKFKRPPAKAVALVPASPDALESKRLKKSALMAELFGPTTFHQLDSDQSQQVHPQVASNRSFSAPPSSVAGRTDEPASVGTVDAPVLGGYTPTLGTRKISTQGSFRGNPLESSQQKNDVPAFGAYVPTLGVRNQSVGNPLVSSPKNHDIPADLKLAPSNIMTDIPPIDNSADGSAAGPASINKIVTGTYIPSARDLKRVNQVSSNFSLNSQLAGKDSVTQILPEPTSSIHSSQYSESQQASSVEKTTLTELKNQILPSNDNINLKLFKELLDTFITRFFNQFSSSNSKEESFKEMNRTLAAIDKSLEAMSCTMLGKINDQNTLHERRILTLETQISDLVKEKTNLVAKVQMLDNQSSTNTKEIYSLIAANQHCVSEVDKVRNETKEALHKSSHEQIKNSEAKLDILQREMSHILKTEVKWLQKQKEKLKRSQHLLHEQINTKFQQLDQFSSVNRFLIKNKKHFFISLK